MGQRRSFTVRLSEEAHRTLSDFCAEHGITKASFFEALASMVHTTPDEERDNFLRVARQIDSANRVRSDGD